MEVVPKNGVEDGGNQLSSTTTTTSTTGDVSWAAFNIIELMASNESFEHKRIAYVIAPLVLAG